MYLVQGGYEDDSLIDSRIEIWGKQGTDVKKKNR